MPELFAYTDGACSGNPGPGGWGALLQAKDGETVVKERELKGGDADTTNNRMELLAAISALEALERPSTITVVTDSAYVKGGITAWLHSWKRNGWKTMAKKAREERGPLAQAGRGRRAPHRDLGMGQGARRPPRERTRR
jgi:ribonuclease HI